MPATIVLDDQVTFITDPINPTAGTDFTVTWQEKNIGDEDSASYTDSFDLTDGDQGDSQPLECDPLAAGASATRSLTFNLPAGDYTMTLFIAGQGPFTLGNVIVDDAE
jgi:hypothetical protein